MLNRPQCEAHDPTRQCASTPDEVARYFDANAAGEWGRMDRNPYMQLIWSLHMDFIADAVRPGLRVLDAGGGSGRYTVELAERGCEVTLLDISPGELEFARQRLDERGLSARCVCADIRDMHELGDGEFDLTLCYGAPLSYCLDGREDALRELRRVTRPGGLIAASVNGVWGILRHQLCAGARDFFARQEYWHVLDVARGGDCPRFSEIDQPARHFFTADELRALFEGAGLMAVELGAAPGLCAGALRVPGLCDDAAAWATLCELERMTYRDPMLLGGGEFLLARGRVPD